MVNTLILVVLFIMAIMGDFIKLKISLLFMIIFSFLVSSCISFSEEKEMMEFVNRNYTIKWIDKYGILDQVPYSYLIIDSCGKKDTISIYNQIENIDVDDPNSIVYIDYLSAKNSKSEIVKMISYGLNVQIVNTPRSCYEKFNKYIKNSVDYLLLDYQEITDIIPIKSLGDKEMIFSFNFSNENEIILLITLQFEDKELCHSFNNIKCDKSLFFDKNIIILKITVMNKDSVIISLPYNEINKLYGEDRLRYRPQYEGEDKYRIWPHRGKQHYVYKNGSFEKCELVRHSDN